jgi:large subunit ribosomal protein L4
MSQLPLYDIKGQSLGQFEASDKIFGAKMNMPVVQSTLTWFMASQRQGTHSSKTKGEVSGGGKKPWKQKGTGRARAGSNRSPLWRKGGVIFGPKPRDYDYTLPKKVRQLALKVVLSDKARSEKLRVLDNLALTTGKTKLAVQVLKELGIAGKVLVLLAEKNDNVARAFRNINGVTVADAASVNIFDLLAADWLLADRPAIKKIEEALS